MFYWCSFDHVRELWLQSGKARIEDVEFQPHAESMQSFAASPATASRLEASKKCLKDRLTKDFPMK